MGMLVAGTTGKITGRVTDNLSGESLIGCNVMIQSLGIGTATDLQGDYVILNIPPEGSLLPETYNYTKAETRAELEIDHSCFAHRQRCLA